MEHTDLILTITAGLAGALLLGYVTHRLGLSPIVGYLLAGILVGPATPGFVANSELAGQLAEIGVILLMFGVGLQFHLKDLQAVRRVAVSGAAGQGLVATLLGCLVAVGVGWGWAAGLMFGLAISVASTVVSLRVLGDNNELHTPTGHIAIGWLVVQDLYSVLALVLLPVIFRAGVGDAGGVALALGGSLLKIGLLVAFVVYGGGRLFPWLLARVATTRSRELFTLTVLVLALGVAVSSARLFGVSMALGAFLAGTVVGQSDFSSRAAAEALPMRDAFAVLFFVSVGMLFDPAYLLQAPGLVVAILGIILLGKPLAALVIVLLLGHPLRTGLGVAGAVAQIGEFSFILAAMGRELGILPEDATNALVAASILSISLNPLLYRLYSRLEEHAKRSPRLWRWLSAPSRRAWSQHSQGMMAPDASAPSQVIVVGCGPIGSTLVRLLRENEIEPTVIELNLDTVRRLRAEGVRAVYGDATHRETLVEGGVASAGALMLTSRMSGSEEAIRLARELNPKIQVFAREGYLRAVPALYRAGADVVFAGEGEVALAMTEFMLRQLGASPDQVDRERDRIRAELSGRPSATEGVLPPPGTAADLVSG